MSYQATGTITHILDVQSGTSQAGKDWKKTTLVIDTGAEYNNIMSFTVFGEEKVDKLLQYNKVGDKVDVKFNVSSREYEGKYFPDVSAWSVFKAEEKAELMTPEEANESDDDLPF
jgi:hypothetical protein